MVLAMSTGMDSAIFDPLDKTLMGMVYTTEGSHGTGRLLH